MTDRELTAAVQALTGSPPKGRQPLSGGCLAQVYRIECADGSALLAKLAEPESLAMEARMLSFLRAESALPVPAVLHAGERVLLLEFVEASGALDAAAQAHAAELLAELHGLTADRFGFAYDTVIGPLPQPNGWSESWIDFFGERRLLYMGRLAHEAGQLPAAVLARLEGLCGRLDRWIDRPSAPSLLHGDLWGGNVLVNGGRIAAFIDPAIYYGDAEIELAFSTLFGTFGRAFFDPYQERRPLAPGFFEVRRDLYNLYPLLVHSRLFGGHYIQSVRSILDRFA